MNNARLFIAGLMLQIVGMASACWYPTYEPQYYLTYNLTDETDCAPSDRHSMTAMWQSLLPGASADEVNSLIYPDGYSIDAIRGLDLPSKLKVMLKNDSLLHDYIVLMRQTQSECAKTTDPWYFYYDNDPRLLRLDSLANEAGNRLSGIYGDRYAVQAARALRALKRYTEIINIAQNHEFKDAALKALFNECLASAFYHTGRYEQALEFYSRAGDETSLAWTLDKLGMDTNPLTLAYQLSFYPGKESSIARLLQTHIRRMELNNDTNANWDEQQLSLPEIGEVISIAREAADKGLESYKPIWQYTEGFAHLMGPVNYAKADSVFAGINLEKASSHLKDQVRTLRLITRSYLLPYDESYKTWFAREAEWLCARGKDIINSQRTEHLKELERYRQLYPEYYGNTSSKEWLDPFCKGIIFARNTHHSDCYPLDMLHRAADCIVVPKMLAAKDTVAALQLLDVVDHAGLTVDEIKLANSHGCASVCFAMECGADIAKTAQSKLNTNSTWTAFVRKNGSIAAFPDRWNDLIATLLLGEARYDEAIPVLDRISGNYALHFDPEAYNTDRNPFAYEFLSKPRGHSPETRLESGSRNYKKWFAQRMVQLQSQMNDSDSAENERAKAAVEYATGMSNSVYPCWALTQYGVGEELFFPYDMPDETDGRRDTEIIHDFFCNEYPATDFARSRQRLKALRKEAGKILRNQIAKMDDEEAADFYRRIGYYRTVKHHYANTDIARQLKHSCDRWTDW